MVRVVSKTLLTSGLFLGRLLSCANGAKVTFKSQCPHPVDLYDNKQTKALNNDNTIDFMFPQAWHGMFRHGKNPQATLAEFSTDMNRIWYDISIIPTSYIKGPGYCGSLEECKRVTGGVGFNSPMQIAPVNNIDGKHCRVLTCLQDGCEDAYNYPKDDTKTFNCPSNTDFEVTFCPNGAVANTIVAPNKTTSISPTIISAPLNQVLEIQESTVIPQMQPVVTATPVPSSTTIAPTTSTSVEPLPVNVQVNANDGNTVASEATKTYC